MIRYDIHMHTAYSSDSEEKMEEQVKSAISKGLSGICITDHMDYLFPDIELFNMDFLYDIDANYREIDSLREKYDRIEILKGVELGLRNEPDIAATVTDMCKKLINRDDIDFVIGATHCLEKTDPYRADYWQGRSVYESLRTFFEATLQNIKANPYVDTLAHLDYGARYARKPGNTGDECDGRELYIDGENGDIIDEILKFIIDKGIALEVNSAGLKYGLGYAHPKHWILRRYKELKGELITVGADAHKREHVAFGFDTVKDMLTDIGFTHYAVYRKRKSYMYNLND